MPVQMTRSTSAAAAVPSDLSPTGKLIYLYLRERGRTDVDELKRVLGIPQIQLYPVIDTLEERDLVDRSAGRLVVPR